MLDDLKLIHTRDKADALGAAAKQWQQLNYDFANFQLTAGDYQNVVLGAMGGSAFAGLLAKSWLDLRVPFEIVRNYTAPDFISEKTLFIASSYSGNTEETLSALEQAESKNAKIVIVTSGGKLAEIASDKSYPLLKIPAGFQARQVTNYNLRALARIFDTSGLAGGASDELAGTDDWLKAQIESWLEVVPTGGNQAKQLALEIMGKSVVVYAGPRLAPSAYKWKIGFNENAKHVAWWNEYPEFDHNEFIGWTQQPIDKPYAVIELRSSLEHPRVQRRFEVSNRLLSGLKPESFVVDCQGETLLKQLLWADALGDFTSIYLALLANVDPTELTKVDKLKEQMEK